VVVGEVLGVDDALLTQLDLGGHLHDIGKIGVREAVLNKAGPLSDDEYAHIMQHPVIGSAAQAAAERPAGRAARRALAPRALGRPGRAPDGLSAGDIPLAARIAAVADSFDAMTSHRPYRRGRTMHEALQELQACAGTQYDPEIVGAFEQAVAEGRIRLP
jgi:HD-GYP domain-containing protein (c-di-GMP phosphodiesterase class II)